MPPPSHVNDVVEISSLPVTPDSPLPPDRNRRDFVKKSLAASIIAAQPTILAGLVRAQGGGGETTVPETTVPWETTESGPVSNWETTVDTTDWGTTYETSDWETTVQETTEIQTTDCTAQRQWTGTKETHYKFLVLKEEILSEIRSSWDDFVENGVDLAQLPSHIITKKLTPTGSLGELLKRIVDASGAPQQLEELKNELIDWMSDHIFTDIIDAQVEDLLLCDASETQTWYGTANQYSLVVKEPYITGPEMFVDDGFGIDLEIDGVGIKATVERTLGIFINQPGGQATGFKTEQGGPVAQQACPCSGGTATLIDTPLKKGSFKIDLTFLCFNFKGTGTAERLGNLLEVPIQSPV